MTPRTVKDGADISNLRQRMRAKWKIKWGEMHKMFLCQSGQEKFFDFFCFSLPSLCVSCYLSEWKASLSHGQACFLVVSVMRRSVNISWLWVGVNVLEKSLKTVKYKTKSMCISLSLWFPLPATCATHLPPLYRLPDTTSTQRLQLDVKAHKGWGGRVEGMVTFLWSLEDVTPVIASTSRLRQLPAPLRTNGVGQIRPRLGVSGEKSGPSKKKERNFLTHSQQT